MSEERQESGWQELATELKVMFSQPLGTAKGGSVDERLGSGVVLAGVGERHKKAANNMRAMGKARRLRLFN